MLTTVTLLGLLVATAAAFAITEHLKLIKSPVYGTLVAKQISPVCDCRESTAAIRIRIRHHDRVTLKILDSHGRTVSTIVSDAPEPARRHLRFDWDGHTETGVQAPDGVYNAEVHLANARRTILLPNRIVLDTTTPEVASAEAAKPILFAGHGRSVAIHYSFSEPANAVVYLRHRQIIRGRPTRQHYRIKWAGTFEGRPLPAGRYVLSVGARDAAGNQTQPGRRKSVTVVVRYIDLTPRLLSVRRGARFTVRLRTAAPRYTWRLGRRHGARRGRHLQLRAPTTPGTYHLVVGEHGHTATAVVRVRAK